MPLHGAVQHLVKDMSGDAISTKTKSGMDAGESTM